MYDVCVETIVETHSNILIFETLKKVLTPKFLVSYICLLFLKHDTKSIVPHFGIRVLLIIIVTAINFHCSDTTIVHSQILKIGTCTKFEPSLFNNHKSGRFFSFKSIFVACNRGYNTLTDRLYIYISFTLFKKLVVQVI